jgi:hypothetical protein
MAALRPPIAVGDYVFAHVNFLNLLTDSPTAISQP